MGQTTYQLVQDFVHQLYDMEIPSSWQLQVKVLREPLPKWTTPIIKTKIVAKLLVATQQIQGSR